MHQEQSQTRVVSLSVEEWCSLAKQGIAVPITTRLHGSSMEPLIRRMKDPVTIIPVDRELVPGDVVLFERADGVHVVHRLYRISQDKQTVQTWGDNCDTADRAIPVFSVLGLVVAMEKNGKRVALDTEEQRAYGIRWMNSRWRRSLWLTYKRARSFSGRAVRKLYPDFHKDGDN